MKKVVGLGACVLDTLICCDTYPTEDKKQKAKSIFLSGGGPVGNALVVMSKLGVKTEVIGGFGSDNAGRYLLDDFKSMRINNSGTFCQPLRIRSSGSRYRTYFHSSRYTVKD